MGHIAPQRRRLNVACRETLCVISNFGGSLDYEGLRFACYRNSNVDREDCEALNPFEVNEFDNHD